VTNSARISGEARIETSRVDAPPPDEDFLCNLARLESPAALESTSLDPDWGRHSIYAACPLEVLTLRDGVLTDAAGNVLAEPGDAPSADLWRVLAETVQAVRAPSVDGLSYAPGWIGYIGYEIGRTIEKLPCRAPRDTALPDLRLALYDAVLVYDAIESSWTLATLAFDRPPPRAGRAQKLLMEALSSVDRTKGKSPTASGKPADSPHAGGADTRPEFTPEEYRSAVDRCIEYIADGDVFQVNLSQRFTMPDCPNGRDVYFALRRRNPACYAAYLAFREEDGLRTIASSSPELFLRVRNRHVITRPIKGTRPRMGDDVSDEAARLDLQTSPKDNAELAMIVDLLRNDLGRVCQYGSVRVTDPQTLETHPTVYHLVATVEGDLRNDAGVIDLLRATMPGGSITGAPKIRAMEIIDELEPAARGVYTGSIGHLGVDGNSEWNIVIRTVVCKGSHLVVQAGGGIVADSTAEGEYQETLDKARALLEAIAIAQAGMAT
jgi:para-aminobenzoate synthetase component 1